MSPDLDLAINWTELSTLTIFLLLVVFINRHYVVDSQKCSHFLFVSLEFSTILLDIQITFIDKRFDGTIKISYSNKYIKGDVAFWKLMDNVGFQTLLFLCIWNQIQIPPIKFSFTRFNFFFFAFSFVFFFSFAIFVAFSVYNSLPKFFQ